MNIKFGSVRFLIIIFFSLLISIFLTQLPLTNILHYEFSVIFSLVNFFLSAYIYFSKKISFENNEKYIAIFFINLIPFLVSFSVTHFSQVCNPFLGIPFYLIFVPVASLIGWSLAAFSEFQSYKFRVLIFIFLSTFLFFEPILEIYFLPQIYFYNPVVTFFPGTIYDEDISITLKIISYRGIILFIYLSVLFFIRSPKMKVKKAIIVALAYILFSLQFLIKVFSPFQTQISDIYQNLGGKTHTEHFVIYFPKELKQEKIKYLKSVHEFYYSEIKNILNDDVSGKITSFIFRTEEEKKILTGAGNADFAKPWLKQIFMEVDSYEKVLKHELAHVFSGNYGETPFRIAHNFNPAMIEGFATAIDNNFRNEDLFYSTFLLYQLNKKISFESIFNSFNFFTQIPSVGYLYSGAFIRFLIETYGIEKVKFLYGNLDFQKNYGQDLKILQKEFYEYIKKQNFTSNQYKAQLYFSGLPLIKKSCAHEISVRLKFADQLFSSGKYDDASKVFREIYLNSNNYEALTGYIESLIKQKKFNLTLKVLQNEIPKVKNSGFYFYLKFKLGDLYILNDNLDEAKIIFTEISNMNLNYAYNIQSEFRLCLAQNDFAILKKFLSDSLDENSVHIIIDKCNKSSLAIVLRKDVLKYSRAYLKIKNYLLNEFVINDVYDLDNYLKSLSIFIDKNDFVSLNLAIQKLNQIERVKTNSIQTEQIKKFKWISNLKGGS